jgi:hypothetical protein
MSYEVTTVNSGLYLLNYGEDATAVARRVYGDVHKAADLIRANPGDWEELERVEVPNKKGRITCVEEGEGPQSIIRRMFPNQPESIYLQPFFKWNGGEDFPPAPGELVFIPER